MQKEAYSLPVYRTEDYSIFTKLAGNRELYSQQVKRLAKAIDQNPEFTLKNPIKVNEKMEIIDGQHRVAAYEMYFDKTGNAHPVYYTIVSGASINDARSMNAGAKAWLPQDYAAAYAQEGNENYQTYLEFMNKYKLNYNVLVLFLTGARTNAANFRNGDFVVADAKKAKEQIEMLLDVGPLWSNWPNASFGIAFYKIVNSPRYNHARFKEQMEANKEGLDGVPSRVQELTPAMNMIYNWGKKDKIDLLN